MSRTDSTGRPRTRFVAPLALIFAAVLAAAGLAALGPRLGGAHAFHGTAYPEPEPAPDFALTDHTGRTVGLANFRGSPVLLFFGFTHCPDVCPLTLQRLSAAVESIGRGAAEVRILLITVDPERDTPEALASYVGRFGPQVDGLTGDPAALEALRRDYGVYAAAHAAHDEHEPMIMHTDAVFGVDRRGRLQVLLHADGPAEQLEADIRTLLRL